MLRKEYGLILASLVAVSLMSVSGCGKSSDTKSDGVTILVAAQDIKPGTPLTMDLLEEAELPERLYTDEVFTAGDLKLHLSHPVLHFIPKGQPVYRHNFEEHEAGSALGNKIRPGGRAYPLRVDPGLAVGSWLRDHDHVDIIATFQRQTGSANEVVSTTLIENIVVLRVNQSAAEDAYGKKILQSTSVVVLVLPEEAELLHMAQATGKIGISLRNPDDRHLMPDRRYSTLESLLTVKRFPAGPALGGTQPPEPPPAVAPPTAVAPPQAPPSTK